MRFHRGIADASQCWRRVGDEGQQREAENPFQHGEVQNESLPMAAGADVYSCNAFMKIPNTPLPLQPVFASLSTSASDGGSGGRRSSVNCSKIVFPASSIVA
jgi:hypothetical protein